MNIDTLFFDGNCSLCTKEINALQSMAGNTLCLQDIHQLPLGEATPDRETLLKLLHLRTAEGDWITGVEASVQAWSHTKAGFLWKPLRWPFIRFVAAQAYNIWAIRRYERLYGASCQTRPAVSTLINKQ